MLVVDAPDRLSTTSAGTATIRVAGTHQRARGRASTSATENKLGGVVVENLKFDGDRGRPEWRAIPVATPGVAVECPPRPHLLLPDARQAASRWRATHTLPPTLAGQGGQASGRDALPAASSTSTDRLDATAAEVAPADQIAATRAALALAKSRTSSRSPRRAIIRPTGSVVRDARARRAS